MYKDSNIVLSKVAQQVLCLHLSCTALRPIHLEFFIFKKKLGFVSSKFSLMIDSGCTHELPENKIIDFKSYK
jgi:hypothetical protein